MANSIGWGQVYCYSEWGDESNKLAVPEFPIFCSLKDSNCGTTYNDSDGAVFPERLVYNLGAVGQTTLDYEAFGIPDKWVIIQDGVEILNTGYRGDLSEQADLNAALAALGLPPETIQGPAAGSSNFIVNNLTPIYVYIYAPMTGTAFQTTVQCLP
tara:strand:- start:978 stop:1445 length:468 start_codon:yes stop_codon:yes gene_type:complete